MRSFKRSLRRFRRLLNSFSRVLPLLELIGMSLRLPLRISLKVLLAIYLTPRLTSSEQHPQNSHAHIESVVGLAEIGCARIGIYCGIDLVDAREWMHDDSVVLHAVHH